MQNHELETFEALIGVVQEKAREGEMFFQMDVKPPFPDTPNNWADRLESAFTAILDQSR